MSLAEIIFFFSVQILCWILLQTCKKMKKFLNIDFVIVSVGR